MENLKALYEKKGEIVAALTDLRGRLGTSDWTAERQTEFEKIDADYSAIEGQIRAAERMRDVLQSQGDRFGELQERGKVGKGITPEEYRDAWHTYMRFGNDTPADKLAILGAEKRGTNTQVVGTDSLGGYTVPTYLFDEIEKTMKYFGPMLDACRVITTATGATLEWNTVNDTATVANQIAEASAVTVQDLTFGQKTFTAYKYATLLKMSWELNEDSVQMNEAMIVDTAGERIGRKMNSAFTNGSGSSQAQGITTATSAGKTAADDATFTIAELIDLQHSVDIAYRRNPRAAWMMSDSIAAVIRKLAIGANDARFLWEPSLLAGQPDRLLGHAVWINNDMPTSVAAATKIVWFGDWSKFVIRRVNGIYSQVLNERFADTMEKGYLFAARADSELMNADAIKHLITAAS